jgi:hypothetical protein
MLRAARLMCLAVLLTQVLVACGTGTTAVPAGYGELPGTIELNQGQLTGDEPLAGAGTGTVDVAGRIYHFTIGGQGVDGAAVAIIQTVGQVYRLNGNISGFPGIYRRAPSASIVPGQPAGGVWLQNEHGTLIHLLVPSGGRMPDIRDDGVIIAVRQ